MKASGWSPDVGDFDKSGMDMAWFLSWKPKYESISLKLLIIYNICCFVLFFSEGLYIFVLLCNFLTESQHTASVSMWRETTPCGGIPNLRREMFSEVGVWEKFLSTVKECEGEQSFPDNDLIYREGLMCRLGWKDRIRAWHFENHCVTLFDIYQIYSKCVTELTSICQNKSHDMWNNLHVPDYFQEVRYNLLLYLFKSIVMMCNTPYFIFMKLISQCMELFIFKCAEAILWCVKYDYFTFIKVLNCLISEHSFYFQKHMQWLKINSNNINSEMQK